MKYEVRVGHQWIRIEPASDDELAILDCSAIYLPLQNKILVRESAPAEEQVRLVLHEIVHAFYDVYAWPDEMDQEATCENVDWALTNFWMSNSAFMQTIHTAITQRKRLFGSI